MRRVRCGLFVGAILAVAGFTGSAGASSGTVELSAGFAKCSTNLGASEVSMGGGVSFGASYWRPISPAVSWGAEVSMDNLGSAESNTDDALTMTTFREEFSSRILRINPALRLNLGATVGPTVYVQGGAGWYQLSWDYSFDNGLIAFESGDESSEFGFNVGAGLGCPVGPRTRLTVSGTYHVVPGNNLQNMENTNNIQARAGLGFGL